MILPLSAGFRKRAAQRVARASQSRRSRARRKPFALQIRPGNSKRCGRVFFVTVLRRTCSCRTRAPRSTQTQLGRRFKVPDSSATPTPESPEVVLTASYSMDDGRYANNGWLQELPDPITKLTWDNAAAISPAYAKHLGVLTGDLLQITISEKSAGGQPVKRSLLSQPPCRRARPIIRSQSRSVTRGRCRLRTAERRRRAKETAGHHRTRRLQRLFPRTAASPYFAVAGGRGSKTCK
jgi:hypothetical protein